jgi:GTPase SAR1 family protein
MGSLTDSVTEICDAALHRLPPSRLRREVEAVRRRAREPVRVAVAGRVSSGKSTLVNALLGMRVAPTAATECTQIVTWFRWGEHDEATLHLRDGTRLPLALTSRRALPESLDVDLAEVAYIDVQLYNSHLKDFTLIDTPGLSSLGDGARGGTTEAFLLGQSRDAVARADALLYVVSGDVREDDLNMLGRFRTHAAELDSSAANAVAVLTKVDRLGETADSAMEAGKRIAARCARELGTAVATVVPVMGLMAEAAEAGRVDEERARRLRMLTQIPVEERPLAFRSARRLQNHTGLPLAADAVDDLLERLDILGVRVGVEAVVRGRTGARAITEELGLVSSINALRALLFETFGLSGDSLKAKAALTRLHRLQAQGRDPAARAALAEELRAGSERLKLLPDSRRLRAMEVMNDLAAAGLSLPEELHEHLRRMATGPSAADQLGLPASARGEQIAAAAIRAAGRWRRFGNDGRRRSAEQHAAQVMGVALAGLAREAREAAYS